MYNHPIGMSLVTKLLQIRIVVDTHQDEKPNKKKKKHRGYAFVVYEREKDMQGNSTPNPLCP
jgi:U1 small nuclear ribonucleoprotein